MISLQTNVDALDALSNLNTDNAAQSKTIQQLSSGFRINSSGDDAAGLAVANGYQNQVTQLTQGVANANNGIAQLQIVDGGLSDISNILNRLQTLATESASGTFTGNRATLNQEYQNLLGEITRQATSINLNSGGTFNTNLDVFLGGSNNLSNAVVSINLSGANSAVDATSLGLTGTNILGGGVGISGNTKRIDAPGATFVIGTAGTDDQTFTFNIYANGTSTQVTAKVAASASGSSLSQVLSSLNGQLNQYSITASVDNNGHLEFSGSTAFTATDNGTTGTPNSLITNDTNGTAVNTSNYTVAGQATYAAGAQTLSFETSSGAATVSLLAGDNLASAISKINAQTASLGVYAVANAGGTGISLQSANSFSVNASAAGAFAAAGYNTAVAPTTGDSTNAQAAITAIATAISNLGLVQGRVGAGENQLNYAIGLAQSQVTNFSSAEGDIKDTDVASQASNLTKFQVLEQTAVAALAQANAEPQDVLKLLQ
jgi:flagellin